MSNICLVISLANRLFYLRTHRCASHYHKVHIIHTNPVFGISRLDDSHFRWIDIYVCTIASAVVSHYTIAFGYFRISRNHKFLTDKIDRIIEVFGFMQFYYIIRNGMKPKYMFSLLINLVISGIISISVKNVPLF